MLTGISYSQDGERPLIVSIFCIQVRMSLDLVLQAPFDRCLLDLSEES